MKRVTAHERFDAIVDLAGDAPGRQIAYGLVKITYEVGEGGVRLTTPQPLFHDTRHADTKHRLLPGSDFCPWKSATDVIVLGKAFATRPSTTGRVALEVGDRVVRIAVFGRRVIEWERGRARIGGPAAYEALPLGLGGAYGGVDPRVPLDPSHAATAAIDHRGLYPRNPFGSGYLVGHDPIEGIALPSFELADDLLSDDRLCVGDPSHWWRQPRPAHLGFVPANAFPRSALLGAWPPEPPPQDERLDERRLGVPLGAVGSGLHPYFFQESVPELVFASLRPGTPFIARGLRPDGRPLAFALPEAPDLSLSIAGERAAVDIIASSVVIAPEHGTVALLWVVRSAPLRRVIIPGIHRKVPLLLTVDGVPITHAPPDPPSMEAP